MELSDTERERLILNEGKPYSDKQIAAMLGYKSVNSVKAARKYLLHPELRDKERARDRARKRASGRHQYPGQLNNFDLVDTEEL